MPGRLATAIIAATLGMGCLSTPADSGSTGSGTTSAAGATGTSGSTGGEGGTDAGPQPIDGGAVTGIECADAGTCNPNQYCLKWMMAVAGVPTPDQYSCVAVPACDAEPDCACFTSPDGGVCYDPNVSTGCEISSGELECSRFFP